MNRLRSHTSPLVLIVLFMSFMMVGYKISWSDEKTIVDYKDLVLDQKNGLVYTNEEPFTGMSMKYYSIGNTESKNLCKKGKKHGETTKWFENGQISYESTYVNGRPDGISKSWWKNGKLRTKSNYAQGIVNGDQYQFYQSGALFKKIHLVYSRESGLQQSWTENGKLYNNY